MTVNIFFLQQNGATSRTASNTNPFFCTKMFREGLITWYDYMNWQTMA